jgi:hypothetical protein
MKPSDYTDIPPSSLELKAMLDNKGESSEPEPRPSKRNDLLRVDQAIQLRTLMPLVEYSD